MTDIAVIILSKNEALHIRRCLERLRELAPRQIFVVDCFSTDGSDRTAADMGATVVQHEWPGCQSVQFNWALDNLPIKATWVLRLDADEYLTAETAARLRDELPRLSDEVAGLTLELKRKFLGGEIRHGTNGIRLLRAWRYGKGRLEDRAMDEHAIVDGEVIDFDGAFYDDNLNTMDWWREKHRGYARREAVDALAGEKFKSSKAFYYRCPRYLWMWHFWQGLWYRWLVDREIGRVSA